MSLAITGATSVPPERYFPSRNDVMNIALGGGFAFGCHHEVYGPSDSYKTTQMCEHIAVAQSLGMAVIVMDREGRIKANRLELVGADPAYEDTFYFDDDTWTLTVEKCFELIGRQVHAIRCNDALQVAEKIKSKKGAKTITELYRRRLNLPSDAKPAAIAKGLYETTKSGPIAHWHRLAASDRRDILVVIDSTTSMPAATRVTGDKKPSVVEDRREQEIRSTPQGSRTMGQEARSWSTAFQGMTWKDSSVICFMVSQQRLRGFNRPGRMPYNAPARPNANAFYARTHMSIGSIWDDIGAEVMRHPSGGWYFSKQSVDDPMEAVIGNRLMCNLKKAAAGAYLGVPAVYMKGTGIDRPNTVWEALTIWGLVVKPKGKRKYQIEEAWLAHLEMTHPEVSEVPALFDRMEFVASLYAEHGHAWVALLQAAVEGMPE